MQSLVDTTNPDTIKAIRANLILRGSSLLAWAKENDVKRQNLCKALAGEWKGPRAQAVVAKLLADLEMDQA